MTASIVVPQEVSEGNNIARSDSRFKLIKETQITIPKNYNHSKHLSSLDIKDFYFFSSHILDTNFKNTTNKLLPTKEYKVKLFEMNEYVCYEEHRNFLRNQNSLLVNMQGLSILYQLNKQIFPVGKVIVSLDALSALFTYGNGNLGVPFIYRQQSKIWNIGVCDLEFKFCGTNFTLCFYE